MRLYTFINCYLSQIQQGIQTAHILGEMAVQFRTEYQDQAYWDYLNNHKTIIVCNGGNNAMIRETVDFFKDSRNPYQFATFYEDQQSLDGALTGVGIILPPSVYDVTWNRDENAYEDNNKPGVFIREGNAGYFFEMIKHIKSHRLA